jgi:hypothetical protein
LRMGWTAIGSSRLALKVLAAQRKFHQIKSY